MKRRTSPDDTRDRIIRAAGEIFGRHGFDGTTIRQITKRAGVNVAAVNYHFRDKAELYLRVLREAKGLCTEMALQELSGGGGEPEDKLRAFILTFVRGLLDPARPEWHMRVITQEMIRPTPALDFIVREMTEPIYRRMRDVIGAVAGAKLPGKQLDMLAFSILGQCLFYVRSRAMLERLAPELSRGEERIGLIAGHIATFSLAAICHLYKNKKSSARGGTALHPSRFPALQTS